MPKPIVGFVRPGFVALAIALAASALAMRSPSVSPASPDFSWGGSHAALAADTVTQVQMRNVDFYVDPQIALHIRNLRGTMRSKAGGPVIFDDKTSFVLGIESGEVGLTGADLSLLLNKYVFNYPGAPLKRLSVSTSGSEIVQKGTLRKVLEVPFEIRAALSVSPEGLIRIHPTRTEIMGLHVDDLMKALGIALDEIINLKKAKGASIRGNDIYLDPQNILPPPSIEGHVTGIRVERKEVVQTFSPRSGVAPATLAVPDQAAPNYMFYKGGTLRFGKLMMLDADMQIVDLDPVDPFRFNLDRYLAQLVAGYSRTTPASGLEVYMRDIDKLGEATLEIRSAIRTPPARSPPAR